MPHKRSTASLAFRKERGRSRRAGAEDPVRLLPGEAAPAWKPRRDRQRGERWGVADDRSAAVEEKDDWWRDNRSASSSPGPAVVLTPGPNATHGASRNAPADAPAALTEKTKDWVDKRISEQSVAPREEAASSVAPREEAAASVAHREEAAESGRLIPLSAEEANEQGQILHDRVAKFLAEAKIINPILRKQAEDNAAKAESDCDQAVLLYNNAIESKTRVSQPLEDQLHRQALEAQKIAQTRRRIADQFDQEKQTQLCLEGPPSPPKASSSSTAQPKRSRSKKRARKSETPTPQPRGHHHQHGRSSSSSDSGRRARSVRRDGDRRATHHERDSGRDKRKSRSRRARR